LEQVAALLTRCWRDLLGPNERPYPVSDLQWELTGAARVVRTRIALVAERDELLGALLQRMPLRGRPSSWLAYLVVAREARRRGVGRALLDAAAAWAASEARSRLAWRTPAGSPAATAFSSAVGACRDEVLEQNRLEVARLDRSLLESWEQAGSERSSGYDLVGWDGPCPDEWLEQFAQLQDVMNDAPGQRAEDGISTTVEHVRDAEERWLPRGPYWRLCARCQVSGQLVGFTELQLPTGRPWLAEQGDTAVHPEHRRLGLGRWLKAATGTRLLAERPDLEVIETFNAAGNEAMIAINREMGFRTVCRWSRWSLAL
jgi:GNAT superfamily N-acetyltransferase